MSVAIKAAVGVAVTIPAMMLMFLVVIVGGGVGGQQQANATTVAGPVCATSGPLAGLDAAQASNARIIIAVAESRGGSDAAVISIMVALDESGLQNLGNTSVAGSATGQGVGSDHDSIGLFQQRASWGSIQQRLDPTITTNLFLDRLLKVPSWASMQPQMAAQTVQVSGDPTGTNYQAQFSRASDLVALVNVDASALNCGASPGEPANTAPGSHGLPTGYTIPATADPAAAKAIMFVLAQFGTPYVFGASGPESYDCSGLTMAAWATSGITLIHQTDAQITEGQPVASIAAASPGDLVLVAGDDGTVASPGHVGMYLGDGLVVSDMDPSQAIQVQTYQQFVTGGNGLSGIRHIA